MLHKAAGASVSPTRDMSSKDKAAEGGVLLLSSCNNMSPASLSPNHRHGHTMRLPHLPSLFSANQNAAASTYGNHRAYLCLLYPPHPPCVLCLIYCIAAVKSLWHIDFKHFEVNMSVIQNRRSQKLYA